MTHSKNQFHFTDLNQNFLKKIPEETLKKLEEIRIKLNKCNRSANVARSIGTAIEITGGLATILGLIAAPYTFGISVGLSFGGLLLNTTGLLTNIGASILTSLYARYLIKKAASIIQKEIFDKKLIDKNSIKLNDLINDFYLMTKAVRGSLVIAGKGINNGIKIKDLAFKIKLAVYTQQTLNAVKILSKASTLTMLFGVSASILLLGGDIVQFIDVNFQIRNNKKSSESNKLNKVICELKDIYNEKEAIASDLNTCNKIVFVVCVYEHKQEYK